jgi:hypothetical protein
MPDPPRISGGSRNGLTARTATRRAPTRRTTGRRRTPNLGIVDYTLAKRALLGDFRRGGLSRREICDAHPELLRAARSLGVVPDRTCPVCESAGLRLLAYVFAEGLRANNGRAFALAEALTIASAQRGGACYVVEVCLDCSWNHLSEAFLARSAG